MSQLLSTAVFTTAGLACKAFLNSGLCSITVTNLPVLLDALQCQTRRKLGQGVVTVSNHLSTLDDPVVWGALPARSYLSPHTRRWVLGASDILFTNPLFSTLFRNGQVIETFRGQGVFQPSVDAAIDKLNQGDWIHLFPEGGVRQPAKYTQIDGVTHLPRFKWGVGRVVMDADVLPFIIPVWLTGFDKLMPEGRPSPHKYFPRLGVKLGVTFGDPIPPERISVLLDDLRHDRGTRTCSSIDASLSTRAPKSAVSEDMRGISECCPQQHVTHYTQVNRIRSEVTAIIQHAVEELGRKISGDKLGGPLIDSQVHQ